MQNALPQNLYTCAQTRALDELAIEQHGVPGIVLMKRAGRAAFDLALELWPEVKELIVFCGSGKNGGDGYVIAALAAQRQLPVQVCSVIDPAQLIGDAQRAYQYAVQEGVVVRPFDSESMKDIPPATVVIDALLGTGIKGNVREGFAPGIDWINSSNLPVLAVDIPSGLCGDTGAVLGCAVQASATVTFIGCKQGLLTARGPAVTGQLYFDDLQVPAEIYQQVDAEVKRLQLADLLEWLPERPADAHKGLFGHVMVIGGDKGYGGAAIMAAEAAQHCGAGLVSLATQAEHVVAALVRRPELMAIGVSSGQEVEPYLTRPTVLVVGPGLGQTPWSEQMLQQALNTELPLVLDADGLNLLCIPRIAAAAKMARDHWVLTPHPGEAARLLGISTAQVQQDRFTAVKALQQKWGGVVVLKGAGTLICDGAQTFLANVGNSGMASGGTGDILSGAIGSLLAQGLSPIEAAKLGVCVHGDAGDLAARETGPRGLLATDLIPYMRELLN